MENSASFQTGEIKGMENGIDFKQARQDFLVHLRYTRGHSERTCYNYHSDLGIWGKWLEQASKVWQDVTHVDVEQFAAWQMRARNVKAHIISRRASCLATFYKWAVKNKLVCPYSELRPAHQRGPLGPGSGRAGSERRGEKRASDR
jgi:site-specific recombinase XerD